MTEISTEELARWLEKAADKWNTGQQAMNVWSDPVGTLRQAAARLRALAEDAEVRKEREAGLAMEAGFLESEVQDLREALHTLALAADEPLDRDMPMALDEAVGRAYSVIAGVDAKRAVSARQESA